MANKEKQPTEEYKDPILSVIYKICGILSLVVGIFLFCGGLYDIMIGLGGSQSMSQGVILIFAGTFFIGIAQVITFIAKIELNSRASAEHNRIASKNSIIIVSNTYKTLQAVLEANQTIAPKELPKTDLE
ncbi:hypothetical protein OAG38_00445 [Akkermansiaceae bacterium]|nr:hypothetical protein [Akkermansiaceae bacterium]